MPTPKDQSRVDINGGFQVAQALLEQAGAPRVPPYALAVIQEKNDRTFTRIVRLAAFFDVPLVYAIDTPATLRGNLYSARDRVCIEQYTLEQFHRIHRRDDLHYVICDLRRGDLQLMPCTEQRRVLLCPCFRHGCLPPWMEACCVQRFHVPWYGQAPELCTDQAFAMALYAWRCV